MMARRMTTAEYAAVNGVSLADARMIMSGEKRLQLPVIRRPPPKPREYKPALSAITVESRDRVSAIVNAVLAEYKITDPSQMFGPRRSRYIAQPRQMAMAMCADYCGGLSLVAIGAYFGGRDHTTVMHARKVHAKRLVEPEYAEIAGRVSRAAGIE